MSCKAIELTEYKTEWLPREAIPDEIARRIHNDHGKRISIDPPSILNNQQWGLTSLGWVGFIPISPDLRIDLRPKVALRNLFGMLEYAYTLDLKVLPGCIDCASLGEFYDRLAHLLAKRILLRECQGLYRTYVAQTDSLAYVRGCIDLRRAINRPWDARLDCHFEEHTADVEDNQILAWTLHHIAKSGLCSERSLPSVRKAWRGMTGSVSFIPVVSAACTKRTYTRLNHDYQTSHALCRFFLENSGPMYSLGEHRMFPFLIDMARLYEKFVAAWIREHLPAHLVIHSQERVYYGQDETDTFRIDMIVSDAATGAPLYVLDTKYKTPEASSSEDVAQIRNYAQMIGCADAILVYPHMLGKPQNWSKRGIRMRTLAFLLDGDLERAGDDFMLAMLSTR